MNELEPQTPSMAAIYHQIGALQAQVESLRRDLGEVRKELDDVRDAGNARDQTESEHWQQIQTSIRDMTQVIGAMAESIRKLSDRVEGNQPTINRMKRLHVTLAAAATGALTLAAFYREEFKEMTGRLWAQFRR